MFRRLYGESADGTRSQSAELADENHPTAKAKENAENPYRRLFTRAGMAQLGRILLATIIIAGVSAGLAICMPEGWFMVVFILSLTTLGVLSSFIGSIRKLDLSYDVGMYLIYIFSMAIASMADFSNLDLAGGLYQLAFMTIAVFISLAIHAIFCRLMRVDADSMVISSVSFINSPPFVPMAAAAMRNKNVIVTGLGAGIVGYAVGNHLGVLMAQLLALIS